MSGAVHLKGLWLNAYDDPADVLVLPLAPGWVEDDEVPATVGDYAGGRTRLLVRAGVKRTLTPKLRLLDATQVAALRAREGTLQWVRASTGVKWAGVFLKPSITWLTTGGGHRASVSLTLAEVTASEVV